MNTRWFYLDGFEAHEFTPLRTPIFITPDHWCEARPHPDFEYTIDGNGQNLFGRASSHS
jgi:hypothetical protein